MDDPIMYCTSTTNDHSASVPFWPNALKNICAMGWPTGDDSIPSRSVPMQNASATLIAENEVSVTAFLQCVERTNPSRGRRQSRWRTRSPKVQLSLRCSLLR